MIKKLQGIGNHPAKLAADLKVGDVTVWNYGAKDSITAIANGAKTLRVTFASGYTKRISISTLVAVA